MNTKTHNVVTTNESVFCYNYYPGDLLVLLPDMVSRNEPVFTLAKGDPNTHAYPLFQRSYIYITDNSLIVNKNIKANDAVFDTYSKIVYYANEEMIGTNASEVWEKVISTNDPRCKDLPKFSVQDIQSWIDTGCPSVVELYTICEYGDNCPSMGAYDKQHLCKIVPEITSDNHVIPVWKKEEAFTTSTGAIFKAYAESNKEYLQKVVDSIEPLVVKYTEEQAQLYTNKLQEWITAAEMEVLPGAYKQPLEECLQQFNEIFNR